MENLNFSGQFVNRSANMDFSIDLFQFEEDGKIIIYSPAFDVSGYGNDTEEAKKSFEISIGEFFHYTSNKKTLGKELRKLGWEINESDIKNRRLKRPHLADLIVKNDYLAEILNQKNFTKFDQTMSVPC